MTACLTVMAVAATPDAGRALSFTLSTGRAVHDEVGEAGSAGAEGSSESWWRNSGRKAGFLHKI